MLAVERRDEGLVEEIRKEDSLWYLLMEWGYGENHDFERGD